MSVGERYYFAFKYVDGATQEFEKDDDKLSDEITNNDKGWVLVDNTVINLDNVIKVTIETKSQRENESRRANEQHKKDYEEIGRILR